MCRRSDHWCRTWTGRPLYCTRPRGPGQLGSETETGSATGAADDASSLRRYGSFIGALNGTGKGRFVSYRNAIRAFLNNRRKDSRCHMAPQQINSQPNTKNTASAVIKSMTVAQPPINPSVNRCSEVETFNAIKRPASTRHSYQEPGQGA